MKTWRSAQSRPKQDGYYDVRSTSGDGGRLWMHGSWWQQDYLARWMPIEWVKGELRWRGPKRREVLPLPYIPKP